MILCKELNKRFATKQLMFSELRKISADLIDFKKKEVYKSKDKGTSIKYSQIDLSKISESIKEPFKDDNYYYIVVNTTGVLDSHLDLHVKGIWNRTAKNQNRKNYLLDTHFMSIESTIARKEDVEIMVEEIPFSLIGSSLKGNAEALIYKIAKDKIIDQKAKDWLDSGDDIEASVRMQYVNIEMAMNSEDPEYKEFKAVYDEYINQIANKESFEEEYGEINYFWVVKEAKNKEESSLVLRGSNSETGQIKNDPPQGTQDQDLAKARLDNRRKYLLSKNKRQ